MEMFSRIGILISFVLQMAAKAQSELPKHFFEAYAGIMWEKPAETAVSIYHEATFADDYNVNLKYFPKTIYSLNTAFKYSYGLALRRRLRFVIGLGYQNFKDVNEQYGHYDGGIAYLNFDGFIHESNEYQCLKLMSGLSYTRFDVYENIMEAELVFGLNKIMSSSTDHIEDFTSNGLGSHIHTDYIKSKLFDAALALKYLFRVRKIYFGPFLAYEKVLPGKNGPVLPFSTLYNLKYYTFLSGGIVFRY